MDIVSKLVEFCQEEIAPQYDNGAFSLSMDGNKLYDKFYSAPQKQLTFRNRTLLPRGKLQGLTRGYLLWPLVRAWEI